jgi:hypothetical protein
MSFLSNLSDLIIPPYGHKFHQVERTLQGPGGFMFCKGVHFYSYDDTRAN